MPLLVFSDVSYGHIVLSSRLSDSVALRKLGQEVFKFRASLSHIVRPHGSTLHQEKFPKTITISQKKVLSPESPLPRSSRPSAWHHSTPTRLLSLLDLPHSQGSEYWVTACSSVKWIDMLFLAELRGDPSEVKVLLYPRRDVSVCHEHVSVTGTANH